MTIRFYHNTSERVKIGKTIGPVNVNPTAPVAADRNSLTGTLRTGCSITDPVITFTGLDPTTVAQADYIKIDEFDRYYFITDITFDQANVVTVTAHVDVLESFSTSILNQKGVVARQEKNWNVYLNDDMYKVYSNPYVVVRNFPNTAGIGDSTSWVLAMAGGGL